VKKLPPGEVTQEQGETVLRFSLVDGATGQAGPAIFRTYRCLAGGLTFTAPVIVSSRGSATGQTFQLEE